jgi:DNA invertase Pin-like site-specific DNA recombinase
MAAKSNTHTAKRTLSGAREAGVAGGSLTIHNVARRAVGYVRVSTDMQAAEGLSIEAQQAAIEGYCALHGIKLVRICKDVMSGGNDQRPGLQEALKALQREADILIVLKFDRLSRSIKHFCELYERYFRSGEKELVAIRESLRLDSSLGRALVGILLVFAQMEREATGERTREAVRHIRALGHHFGKVPYGKRAVPAPDNPRFRVLVDEPQEQAVLAKLRQWTDERRGLTQMAEQLNADGIAPPQGERWTRNLLYNLKLRMRWISPRPFNERPYTDEDVKERILELRSRGHTLEQIARILNEQKWLPLKGRQFTERNVGHLLRRMDATKLLGPRRYLENLLERMERIHRQEHPGEPFERPGLPTLAKLLVEAGYATPMRIVWRAWDSPGRIAVPDPAQHQAG